MTDNELKEFTTTHKSNWTRMLKSRHPDLFEIVDKAPGKKYGEKLFNYLNKNAKIQECPTCGSECKWYTNGYSEFCSHKCAGPSATQKWENTMMEKYGTTGTLSVPEYAEKFRSTSLEKYGTVHPSKSDCVQNKLKQTMMEQYGVEYLTQSTTVKKRIKETLQDKYGVSNVSQLDEVKQKRKRTMEKTGSTVDGKMSDSIKYKIRSTNLQRGRWIDHSKFDQGISKKTYTRRVRYLTNKNVHLIEGSTDRSQEYHIDHLFTILDGYLNGIAAEIVAHPANLQMKIGKENIRKGGQSEITLSQLWERIAKFDQDQI